MNDLYYFCRLEYWSGTLEALAFVPHISYLCMYVGCCYIRKHLSCCIAVAIPINPRVSCVYIVVIITPIRPVVLLHSSGKEILTMIVIWDLARDSWISYEITTKPRLPLCAQTENCKVIEFLWRHRWNLVVQLIMLQRSFQVLLWITHKTQIYIKGRIYHKLYSTFPLTTAMHCSCLSTCIMSLFSKSCVPKWFRAGLFCTWLKLTRRSANHRPEFHG